ncbi:MAG: DUF2306 domain-containing protein [Chitinophagales bacterium]|nr:DUF2306 domain-containing protein [Chitinophagales bacterium]
MDLFFKTLLALHIASGFTALTSGLIPMFSKKGGNIHRRFGMVYFWAMFGVFCTAIPMSFMHTNFFLFAIGIFSFYQTFTGYRHTKIKNNMIVPIPDKISTWITFSTSICMIVYSVYLAMHSIWQPASVLTVFGAICLLLTVHDLQRYRRLKKSMQDKQAWYFGHITRMAGSYIATFTAFAITNLIFLPSIIAWLAPTVIGVFLITRSVNYYKNKFRMKTSTA